MKSFTGINKINRNNNVLFIQIITIKNSKTLKIIHDNRGQGLALRSKDLKQKSYLL